ncbi:MAG: O-antigen ligase family protein [Armatimonadetes bacterium]|nr:O-antigen ligase family protein [Armatimonadota bacterium]
MLPIKRNDWATFLLCWFAFSLSLPRYVVASAIVAAAIYVLWRIARCTPDVARILQGVRRPEVLKAAPLPQLLLFLAVLAGLLPFSTNAIYSLAYFLHSSACLTVFLMLVGLKELPPHRHWTRLVIHSLLLGNTVAAMWGIYEVYRTRHLYVTGFEPTPVHAPYGSLLVTAILTAMSLLLAARGPLRRAAYFSVVCICGVALVCSQARGPWLALAASFPMIVYLSRQRLARNRRRAFLSLGAAAALALALSPLYVGHALTIFDPKWEPNSERVLIWKSTLHMIQDRPLTGVGEGLFATVYNAHYISRASAEGFHPHAHNSYLMILAEDGIIGFLPFLYLLWGIGNFLRSALRDNPSSPYIIATAGVFCSLLINSLVDHFLFSGHLWSEWIFWLMLGLVYYDRPVPGPVTVRDAASCPGECILA